MRAGAPIHVARDVIDSAGLTQWPDAEQTAAGGSNPPPWTPMGGQSGFSRTPTYTINEHSPTMLRLAAAQARQLGHGFVAAGHLLLGILADDDGPAARLLQRHGITLGPAREAVTAKLADVQDTPSPADECCLAPAAMLAMQRASIEARRRGTVDITPLHLLLALVDSHELTDVPGLDATDLASARDDVRSELDA